METDRNIITDGRIDQNFYSIHENFTYFLRIEIVLQDTVEPQILKEAVETAFRRFPYFSVTLRKNEQGYYIAPNDAPHVVICDNRNVVLNSPEVNGHLIVVSCWENSVIFHISHCITDAMGVLPFLRTVLYYYLTRRYDTELDPEGIDLADSPFFPDENSVPAQRTENSSDGSATKPGVAAGQIHRLSQSPEVTDRIRMEYRFTTDKTGFMDLCRENHTSPNALVSSLLARAVWKEDPQLTENIVINLCADMRKALDCPHNHSNLTTCIPIIYDISEKELNLQEICANTRKTVTAGAEPQLLRNTYEKSIVQAEKIRHIKKEDLRKKVMYSQMHGAGGYFNCSILVSYYGYNSFESIGPYVKAMFTTIDFIPDGGIAVEFTCQGDAFCFSFMQDFSSDVYVRLFIRELEDRGLTVENEVRMPIPEIGIVLP